MHRLVRIVLPCCFGVCGPALAQGVAIQVSPVSVTLAPGQLATTLSVTDAGSAPTTLQIRAFAWRQADGEAALTPTDTLAISPPIIPIDANTTQTFRLVLQQPAQGQEMAYRLLIDQLPPPAVQGVVRVVLRVSVPVFVAAAGSMPASIAWRVERGETADVLVADNDGSQHTRILDPVLRQAGGGALKLGSVPSPYILPGAEMRWAIMPAPVTGAALALSARTDDGPVSQRLVAP